MDKSKIDDLRKRIYDLAVELKSQVSYGDDGWEIYDEAQSIMNACDNIKSYLDDDPAAYEATMRDLNMWLAAKQGIA